jgi:long-chain acyl-CoA synthetase
MAAAEKPWLSSYPPEVPVSIDYPKVPLYQFLLDTEKLFGDREAIYFMGKRMNYSQLLSLSYRFANLLKEIGIRKGDRVAIMLPNCPQAVFCYYGALMAGAIVVQTNPLYVEREIEYQMNDSGAKVMVALDLLYPKLKKVKANTSLETIFFTSIRDFLPFPKNLLYPLVQKRKGTPLPDIVREEGYEILKERMKAVPDTPFTENIDPTEDLALLQYTGGTTGLPKGVMLTHYNLVVNTLQCRYWTYKGKPGSEKVVSALPFFHVYGMTVAMNLGILMGASLLLVPRFDAGEVLKLIHKERGTMFPGAPSMYIALINHPDIKKYDLSSIEACLSGSAPLPQEVQIRFEELSGGRLVEGYGLSETSPVTHANPIYTKRVIGSIGIPWPDTEAKIVDVATGEDLPVGKVGELAIRGPQVMKGYWNRQEETSMAFLNGWFLTGDLGYMDEEGFFYIVDRKKDMIIAGGYNIYPREVEEVLFEHPAVKEACVIGVPDPYRGETVKAFIVKKQGVDVTEKELEEFTRKKLAAYKIPRIYEFRDELPRTMVGKVLRRVLVEEEKKKLAAQDKETVGN